MVAMMRCSVGARRRIRMSDKEKILAQEVSNLMAEAEAIDKCEDAKFGKTKRGDELAAESARRETRLVALREAKSRP